MNSLGVPQIRLGMTDKDVVERASAMVGYPAVYKRAKKQPNHKDQWWFSLGGYRAVGVMMTIFVFLGERRKAKVKEVIMQWRSKPYKRRVGRQYNINCPHSAKKHYAHGECHACYELKRKKAIVLAVA